jgi:hypothetical protein
MLGDLQIIGNVCGIGPPSLKAPVVRPTLVYGKPYAFASRPSRSKPMVKAGERADVIPLLSCNAPGVAALYGEPVAGVALSDSACGTAINSLWNVGRTFSKRRDPRFFKSTRDISGLSEVLVSRTVRCDWLGLLVTWPLSPPCCPCRPRLQHIGRGRRYLSTTLARSATFSERV